MQWELIYWKENKGILANLHCFLKTWTWWNTVLEKKCLHTKLGEMLNNNTARDKK